MNTTPLAPAPLSPSEIAAELRRRRRGRNLAVLAVLVGLAVLFYAISVVKLARPELGG